MGVKNCPETPRQRMISLMYLVLTAMLALNVDKSVVDAFELVDKGIMETIDNVNSQNRSVYSDFNSAAHENPEKVGELNRTVLKIKERTDTLYNYITHFKEMIVKKADGPNGRIDSIVNKEDLQYAEEVMMTKKNGALLKKAVEDYRSFLLSNIDPSQTSLINSISKSLDTSNPPSKEGSTPSWESNKFQGYPLIAVVTLMSKLQSDIRNTESDVINYFYTKIDASSFKFNNLKAQVIAKSNYVLQGDVYEAKVFISAIDTTAVPDIIVNGSKLPIIPGENAGLYKATAGAEGTFVWKGIINFKNPNGQIVQYPFQQEYQVAKPSMTVSPTKMNILYFGLPNPISISVPGISSRDISVTMKNGHIDKSGDGFLAYPEKLTEKSYITVSATVDKIVKQIGTMEFRVKRVPNPIATVAGKNAGNISRNELNGETGVYADIPEFDFEMKFQVLSFDVSTSKGGFVVEKHATGAKFTQEQRDVFNRLTRGDRLYIDNIVAKGDDGLTRNLSAISFKIN
ncbi:MAG: gliding motility protein GldM [Prolixibacteraceae bacterium]|nr:gliding motility protein GldM [Prolixibacteraceae bacterium]